MRVANYIAPAILLGLLIAPLVAANDEMPAVEFPADEIEMPDAVKAAQDQATASADAANDDSVARPEAGGVLEPAATTARRGGDQMDLDTTAIRGNQELPKVLYIVPWKDPSLGELVGKPVNSLVDEVIAPVDREVFLRQTKYFDQLYADPGTASD